MQLILLLYCILYKAIGIQYYPIQKKINSCNTDKKISTFNSVARLRNAPKTTLLRDLPNKDKIKLAIQWLYENPDESPTTAARCHNIKKEKTLVKAWQREKKRVKNGRPQWGGQNKILRLKQHNAMIQYAVSQAIDGGKFCPAGFGSGIGILKSSPDLANVGAARVGRWGGAGARLGNSYP